MSRSSRPLNDDAASRTGPAPSVTASTTASRRADAASRPPGPEAADGGGTHSGSPEAEDGASVAAMAIAARRPNTTASAREFPAMRLAPWTPVAAHSPAAYRPLCDVRPSRSVETPPIR